MLSRRSLKKKVDEGRVREAIREAELKTSGEVRVAVAPFFWGSVRKAAELAFDRMGMTGTKDRNGVLFFIVPSRRRFVVLGDAGIHEKVGQEFWESVSAALSAKFREGDFTGGLVCGIGEVGQRLAEHFPYDPATDRNELPDDLEI